jgi:hypothetical protein
LSCARPRSSDVAVFFAGLPPAVPARYAAAVERPFAAVPALTPT